MRASLVILLAVAMATFAAPFAVAQTRASKTLDIYVVDVEGGNAMDRFAI